MYTAGIDVGSMTTKAVLFRNNKWLGVIIPTGVSPRQAGRESFEKLLDKAGVRVEKISRIIGTGYGRVSLDFIDRQITEITCHARGAHFLVENTDLVIDIGGQDCKAILTNRKGKVVEFSMNDRCAAGTGRFLQVMATALGCDVSELAELSRGADPVEISNMCTVFAESEVVSLLAQGTPRERIIAGIHCSVARRVGAMADKLGTGNTITFTGGVAKNEGIKYFLERELKKEIIAPEGSQFAGALGAALLAGDGIS